MKVMAKGTSAHSAFPEGSQNAIQILMELLLKSQVLTQEDAMVMKPFIVANEDYYGGAFGIACEDDSSGKLTSAGTVVALKEGHLALHFNIRYPIFVTYEALYKKILSYCKANLCSWRAERNSGPTCFQKEHPAVVCNEYCGIKRNRS